MGQVNGTWEAKEERMKKYLEKVLQLVKKFKETNFIQISREENVEADALAKEASANETIDEFDEVQYIPNIDLPEVLQVQNEENWMTPIISYLKDRSLLEGKDEATKLRVRLARYALLNEVLYKRGFSHPYLRCSSPNEAKLRVEGSLRRSLWEPFKSQITYPQGCPCRILLANHLSIRKGLCQSL